MPPPECTYKHGVVRCDERDVPCARADIDARDRVVVTVAMTIDVGLCGAVAGCVSYGEGGCVEPENRDQDVGV